MTIRNSWNRASSKSKTRYFSVTSRTITGYSFKCVVSRFWITLSKNGTFTAQSCLGSKIERHAIEQKRMAGLTRVTTAG
jgi:hypothetical protein